MKLGNDIFAAVHSILLLWSVCRGSLLFSPTADQLPGTKVVLECHKTLRPYHWRLNGKDKDRQNYINNNKIKNTQHEHEKNEMTIFS